MSKVFNVILVYTLGIIDNILLVKVKVLCIIQFKVSYSGIKKTSIMN